ncbi:MAG: hypothetical protein KGZ73_05175 [Rhizobiales bacterium]|nr:hypothetical protein [Hyphomicrobiales bacterium]
MSSIFEFIAKARDSYRTDSVEITDGYEFSQYETIRTIELYHNSRFLTSNTDSLGREKPFYNICKFRVNVATRATDLDTKDAQIQSGPGKYAQSFLLNLKNRNWMRFAMFGVFLNKMTHTRAKYGGVLVKKVESDDELSLHVVPWRDSITDQVDIRSGAKLYRHHYTPADLVTEGERLGWSNIAEAIEAAKSTREAEASQDGKENKTSGDVVEVWEVHGVLKKSFLDKEAEEYEYERQMHVVVLDESDKDNVTGITLYSGKEKEDPYKYLPYEEVDGRGLGVGVIEDLFEAQVWTNYGEKQKKDMLDLAGKIIFQTADQNLPAQNILTDLENGSVVTHSPNYPLTQVNNSPASFVAFEKLLADWDKQAERVSSTPPAITGETMPSGQPFRLAAMLNQEAGSMFEYRREEAGLFIQEIYQDWVLPFLVKQIRKEKELVGDLTEDELAAISQAVAEHEAAKEFKERILNGEDVTPEAFEAFKVSVFEEMKRGGKKRKFSIPKDFFGEDDDINVDVITTGEQKNKAVVMETLFNVFGVVAKNPAILQDPVLARLFNQIVEIAGVSPLLLKPAPGTSATPTPIAKGSPERIAPEEATV